MDRFADIGELTAEVMEAKRMEKEAIAMAENNKAEEAIRTLSQAIKIAPHLPSLFNNRAQAYRLTGNVSSKFGDFRIRNGKKVENKILT